MPSEHVRQKAEALPAENIDQRDEEGNLWRVTSPRTGREHTVMISSDGETTWTSCTCAHGASRGGQAGCYHAEAVHLRRDEQ